MEIIGKIKRHDHCCVPMDTYVRQTPLVLCVIFVKHCDEIELISNNTSIKLTRLQL